MAEVAEEELVELSIILHIRFLLEAITWLLVTVVFQELVHQEQTLQMMLQLMVVLVVIVTLITFMLLVAVAETSVSITSQSTRMVDLEEVVETSGQQLEQETCLVVQHILEEMLFKEIMQVEHITETQVVAEVVKMVDILDLMKVLVEVVQDQMHLEVTPLPQVMAELEFN